MSTTKKLVLTITAVLVTAVVLNSFLNPSPQSTMSSSTSSKGPSLTSVVQAKLAAALGDNAAPSAGTSPGDLSKPANPVESQSLTPDEFRKLSDEVLRSLPLKSSVAKSLASPEELEHFSPEFLIEAGRQLGRIAGALARNSLLRADAVVFYRDCAGQVTLLDSIRAVCLADLTHLNGNTAQVDAPAKIQRLAERIQ